MNFAKILLKLLIISVFSALFLTTLHAVDIELDNTITKINGDGDVTTCKTGDTYRLGTNATYNGHALDLLVEITAEDNEYDELSSQNDGSCISSQNGIMNTRLRDRDADNDLAYMDLKVTIVRQGSMAPVEVDRIVFAGLDLDKNNKTSGSLVTGTDNIYIKSPAKAYIQADDHSDVTYNEGNFGAGFNRELMGRDKGLNSNCQDYVGDPQPECRGGGITIQDSHGPNKVSSIQIRVSNNNAYGQTNSNSAYRLIQLSFKESDFEAILVDHDDHGDIPATYGDAKHQSTVFTVLGYGYPADNEEAQYSILANLDDDPATSKINFDDEDGVKLGSQMITGTEFNMTVGYTYDLNVTTIGTGYLSVWVDLDGDGNFGGIDEQLLSDHAISSVVAINTIIPLALPTTNYSGRSYIRFRFSENPGTASDGDGGKGEAEDYTVFFLPSGSVSGHVYNDRNGNHTQEGNEPNLPNVSVRVTAANGESQTTKTDSDGNYAVSYVAAGDATVTIDTNTLPSGAIQTEGSNPTTVAVTGDIDNFEENNGFQMQANLVTVKTVDISTPQEGDSVTFTMTVQNHGTAVATHISLEDTLPAGITYTGHNAGQGSYDSSTGIWELGTLNNGAITTLTLTGTVDTGTAGSTITNLTSAASTPDQYDPTTSGDDLEESVVVSTLPTVSISNVTATEGNDLNFSVTLSKSSHFDTVINVNTANGTAVAGDDYTITVRTVTIPAGSTTKTVTVPTLEDTIDEPDESMTLKGTVTSGNTGNTSPSGKGTIVDDDKPNMMVTKTQVSGTNPVTSNGDTIGYEIAVKNTGSASLTGVVVTDTMPNSMIVHLTIPTSGDTNTNDVLDLNETWIFTASYTVDQDDIDSGAPLTNVASVHTDQVGPVKDEATTKVGQSPAIAIIKSGTFQDEDGDGFAQVGETVLYLFNVVNTGNVALTDITVTDPKVTVLGGPIDLEAGAGDSSTFTASYTVTQEDIDAGEVSNQALAEGTAPDQSKVSDLSDDNSLLEDNTTIIILKQSPSIAIIKTGTFQDENNDTFADEGETIKYTFRIKNTGNVELTGITVTDPKVTVVGGPIDLAVGAIDTDTFTALYTVTQEDIDAGKVTNQALAEGTAPDESKVSDLSDDNSFLEDDNTTTPLNQTPAIAIIKSGTFQDEDGDGFAQEGETILYVFNVLNIGNVALVDITVTDPKVTVVGGPIALEAGASDNSTFTASYTITQEDINTGIVTNQALAEATAPDGSKISDLSDDNSTLEDDNTSTVLGQNLSISIVKSAVSLDENKDGMANDGEIVTYTFTVTNTSNVTLTDITLQDERIGIADLSLPDLSVGESTTVDINYTVTEQDAKEGNITNVASTEATTPDGSTVTDESPEVVVITGTSAVLAATLIAKDDSNVGTFGSPVTIDVLANDISDITLDPATVMIFDPSSNAYVTTLAIAGEGVWSVDPTTGKITFTPEAGFVGDPQPISYTVEDLVGNLSNQATVSVFYTIEQHISGAFWLDYNKNYHRDTNEKSIEGSTVEILDENRNPVTPPKTGTVSKRTKLITDDPNRYIVIPDSDGKYGLPMEAGTYIVKFTFPASMYANGYTFGDYNNSNITVEEHVLYRKVIIGHGEAKPNVDAAVNCPCSDLVSDSAASLTTSALLFMIFFLFGTALYAKRRDDLLLEDQYK